MLSQFSRELPQHITLQDFLEVEKDIYPVGRLDKDSEGLLILTNDNKFKTNLLNPNSKSTKSYWVQVEGAVTSEAQHNLERGVEIKLKSGIYRTNIPTSWIEITITEGKHRQVRKMCASVGFPCLRLIRCRIKTEAFQDVMPGKHRPISQIELKKLLHN